VTTFRSGRASSTIADSLDAMISDRPYRKSIAAFARQGKKSSVARGPQFDPKVVEVFMSIS